MTPLPPRPYASQSLPKRGRQEQLHSVPMALTTGLHTVVACRQGNSLAQMDCPCQQQAGRWKLAANCLRQTDNQQLQLQGVRAQPAAHGHAHTAGAEGITSAPALTWLRPAKKRSCGNSRRCACSAFLVDHRMHCCVKCCVQCSHHRRNFGPKALICGPALRWLLEPCVLL